MPVLFLKESDVRDLMDMEMSIEVVEKAFQAFSEKGCVNVPRVRATAPGLVLHTMSATAEYLGLAGWKAYTTTKSGARFHVAAYDLSSGEPIALIEADYLGQLRTGAASGVATEYMARPDSKVVGIFGTGLQARTQLKAVCTVRKIERVEVYSRSEENRVRFAEEMTEYCDTEVIPVRSPDEAAWEKDIVITATTSKTPLFDGRVLDVGTHLNVIGSNFMRKAEIDVTTVQRADHIVCDSIEQCKMEAGDFREAISLGACEWESMHNLADVVAGQKTGRATDDDITLFKSVGLAIEDVAMAGKLIELAREANVGQSLPL
ncbi:MAG: ornithine cyclodeaminase family protein [Planctomycetaceae bacterium]